MIKFKLNYLFLVLFALVGSNRMHAMDYEKKHDQSLVEILGLDTAYEPSDEEASHAQQHIHGILSVCGIPNDLFSIVFDYAGKEKLKHYRTIKLHDPRIKSEPKDSFCNITKDGYLIYLDSCGSWKKYNVRNGELEKHVYLSSLDINNTDKRLSEWTTISNQGMSLVSIRTQPDRYFDSDHYQYLALDPQGEIISKAEECWDDATQLGIHLPSQEFAVIVRGKDISKYNINDLQRPISTLTVPRYIRINAMSPKELAILYERPISAHQKKYTISVVNIDAMTVVEEISISPLVANYFDGYNMRYDRIYYLGNNTLLFKPMTRNTIFNHYDLINMKQQPIQCNNTIISGYIQKIQSRYDCVLLSQYCQSGKYIIIKNCCDREIYIGDVYTQTLRREKLPLSAPSLRNFMFKCSMGYFSFDKKERGIFINDLARGSRRILACYVLKDTLIPDIDYKPAVQPTRTE